MNFSTQSTQPVVNDVYINIWQATGFPSLQSSVHTGFVTSCNGAAEYAQKHETYMQCVTIIQRIKNWEPAYLLVYLLTIKALTGFVNLSAWICCFSRFPSLYCVQEGNVRLHRNNKQGKSKHYRFSLLQV